MKRSLSLLCLFLAPLISTAGASAGNAASPASDADWPGFRGPNGDGVVADSSGLLLDWPAEGLKKVWSVKLHDDGSATHAGPSVSGERVFVPYRADKQDIIVCLDAQTGRELWRYSYSAPGESPQYGTGIRAPPTIYQGRVYTLGCYGQLYCLDAENGKVVWSLDLIRDFGGKAPTFGMSAAPMIMNDLLICEPGGVGTSVVALEPQTGKPVWKSGGDDASYATPEKVAFDGVEQVLAYMDPGLIGYELKTGRELWRFDYQEQRRKNIPQPVVSGDVIYVTNNTLGYAAVRVTHAGKQGDAAGEWSVKRLWSERKEKLHYSSPVIGEGCLFYQNSKHELHCLDMITGELAWTAPNVGDQYGAVLRLGSNNLLTALEDGQLRVFEVSPTAVRERSRFKAVQSAFVQPALAGGRLYLRDHEDVICYEMRAAAYSPSAAATAAAPGKPAAGRISNWDKNYFQFFVSLYSALLLTIAASWAMARRQLPQAAVVCGGAVVGVLLTMLALAILAGANVPLDKAGFWCSTKFFRLAPVCVAMATGLAMNFGCRPLLERAGLKLKRVWIGAASVGVAIFALSRVQHSVMDLESVLLSTVPHDSHSDYSLIKYAVISSAIVALFVQRPLLRSLGNNALDWFVSIIVLRVGVPTVIGFAVYVMGGVFPLAFLLAPVLFAAQFRRGPLLSLALACTAAALSTGAGWLLAQNTKYTFTLPASGVIVLLCLVAIGARRLLGAKAAAPAVSVAAVSPPSAPAASIPANAE